jgi:transposase
VEDWAEIRHLHASQGMSIRAIAKHLGIARATVTRAFVANMCEPEPPSPAHHAPLERLGGIIGSWYLSGVVP